MNSGFHCIKCHHYPCHEPPSLCGQDPTRNCCWIPCPNRCGQGFHDCHKEDHIHYICPLQEVPCLNSQYGCPKIMPRWQIGMHLVKCPASVLHCPVLWHRRVFPSSSEPATDMNQAALSWDEAVTSHFPRAFKLSDMHMNSFVKDQPPFKVQIRKTPGDKPDNLINPKLVDDSFISSRRLSDAFLKGVNVRTFHCDCLLRRDEYAAHMAIHSDCQNALEDWIEQPCPLKYLGCTFVVPRLIPFSFDHCLRLLQHQRTFSWTLADCDKSLMDSTNSSPQRHIFDLPYHIWQRIVYYLDSASLLALSDVCQELDQLVWHLASHRAMVYPSWSKSKHTHPCTDKIDVIHSIEHANEIRFYPQWSLTDKVMWRFSTVPSIAGGNMLQWKVNSHVSEKVLRHLSECPFYQKLEYSSSPVLLIHPYDEAFRRSRFAHST